MSKRCELQKEYYKANGNYKGNGKYCDKYVSWLEDQILALRRHDVSDSVYPKCLKCEFEGMIASNEKEWESGEYFGYNSSNNTVYCPRCSNVQHYL